MSILVVIHTRAFYQPLVKAILPVPLNSNYFENIGFSLSITNIIFLFRAFFFNTYFAYDISEYYLIYFRKCGTKLNRIDDF